MMLNLAFPLLPLELPHLSVVLKNMGGEAVHVPSDYLSLGDRLRQKIIAGRASNYDNLTRSDYKNLPYSFFVKGYVPLEKSDPVVVHHYWSKLLPSVAEKTPNKVNRWLSILFFIYCDRFDPDDVSFTEYAHQFFEFSQAYAPDFVRVWRRAHYKYAFFNVSQAPSCLAHDWLTTPYAGIQTWLDSKKLWTGFFSTQLMAHALVRLYDGSLGRLDAEPLVRKLMVWVEQFTTSPDKTVHRIPFANAVLLPWHNVSAPAPVKKMLMDWFLCHYGDPRIPQKNVYQWQGVDGLAVEVMLAWLAGETVKAFVQILEKTADVTWRYRQKFWMAYIDANHVDDAWLALGDDALREVKINLIQNYRLGYGSLDGAQKNQSVLIIKIKNLIFTEWSHSGSLRACNINNINAPKLRLMHYDADLLRNIISLDFHDGANENPELRHHHPGRGTWQIKARDFIRHHAGIYLRDQDILL